MKVGDLVCLTGRDKVWTGLVLEMRGLDHRDKPWVRVFILFPGGDIDWEYDIDLEVVNECR